MHILAFFLIIIVAVFVMALAAIGNILRSIFGLGRRSNAQDHGQQQRQYTSSQQNTHHTQSNDGTHHKDNSKKQGKIFTEDEGEYVDFEEIKD